MSCDHQGNDVQTKFSSTTPHFFKIILEDTLRDNKLQIPKRIVSKFGGTLSSTVVLKLPCGLRWDLGLTKCDGKVWIEKGWADFVKYYSLGYGDLLVFRYEGISHFHVLIFDKSTAEIDYPSKLNHSEEHDIDKQPHVLVKEETKDDDSVEIQERVSLSPKAREKPPLPCSQPEKRIKISPVGKIQTDQSHHHRPKEGSREKSIPPKSRKCEDVRRQRSDAKGKAQALKRASDFKTKDPFFMVSMQPTYVGAKYLLNIPYQFAKKYLVYKRGNVILKVPNGRTWPVRYSFGMYGVNSKAKFEYGWKAFVQDNNLRVGDVCVFVLTKRKRRVLFDVAIFRKNGIANSSVLPEQNAATIKASQRGSSSNKTVACNGKSRALEIARHFQSENPFFTVAMQASYIIFASRFYIPCKFARKYINKTEGEAILKVSDGRSWPVLYKIRDRLNQSPAAEFCHGWTAFVRGINLEQGEICTFELTNGDDISFDVSIVKANCHLPQAGEKAAKFRSVCNSNNKASMFSTNQIPKEEQEENVVEPADAGELGKLISEENTTHRVTQRHFSSGASRASKATGSTNPSFQVALQADHVKKCIKHLPLTFGRELSRGKVANSDSPGR